MSMFAEIYSLSDSRLLADLRFSTDWPTWLVWSAALVVGVLVMALYLRETSKLDAPWSWILPAMRGTAVVLACLLLAGPVWHHRQIIGSPARIVWAIDRSQSMGERDSQTSTSSTRLRRATDLLFGQENNEGWIEELRDTHLMDVVTFDETTELAWSSSGQDDAPELAGNQAPSNLGDDPAAQLDTESRTLLETAGGVLTDLSSPLRAVADSDKASGNETDADEALAATTETVSSRAVVLFTDGRDSAGRADAGEVATRLADAGWKVHAIAMGSVEEAADVGVVDVDVPERVADDGRLAGRVWVKHFGSTGQTVRVNIRNGESVIWSETIPVSGDGKTPVDFDFPVEPLMRQAAERDVRGVNRDSVALSLSADVSVVGASAAGGENAATTQVTNDTRSANDSIDFRVAAASRDRHLLILDGSSRWEMRYLRNQFSRDPAWAVDTVLFGRGTDHRNVPRGEEPGELPDSSRAWSRYDAVILGEIPPDQWTPQDAARLSDFVAGGGGLIIVDGQYGRIAEMVSATATQPASESSVSTIMAGLIPIRFDGGASALQSIEAIEPTDAGSTNPVMLLDVGDRSSAASTSGANEVWKLLPAPTSINTVTAQPDAEVWADAMGDGGKRSPWLVTRLFGAGRVFYLATDQTWRWRYKVESRLHSRFWNQLMTAAMQPPYAVRDEFVAIGTDKIDYRVGQAATIRVRLLNTDRNDAAAEMATTVDAVLLKDDQPIATLPMRLEDAQRRTYVGQTDGLPAGEYRVRVRASGFDAAALKASTPIWVVPPRGSELDRVSVDQAALDRIASAGGGVAVHESSANEILTSLGALSGGRIVESDTLLWQTWWVFAIIIALLALEWWFRKKVGLI